MRPTTISNIMKTVQATGIPRLCNYLPSVSPLNRYTGNLMNQTQKQVNVARYIQTSRTTITEKGKKFSSRIIDMCNVVKDCNEVKLVQDCLLRSSTALYSFGKKFYEEQMRKHNLTAWSSDRLKVDNVEQPKETVIIGIPEKNVITDVESTDDKPKDVVQKCKVELVVKPPQ